MISTSPTGTPSRYWRRHGRPAGPGVVRRGRGRGLRWRRQAQLQRAGGDLPRRLPLLGAPNAGEESLPMSAAPSVALVPYLGHGDDGAAAWVRLAPDDRRCTAMPAARDHDGPTLWSLTEAWLRTFGPAGAAVPSGTVRRYRCGVHALLAAWTAQDLLRPDLEAATTYIRLLERRGLAPLHYPGARRHGARPLRRGTWATASGRRRASRPSGAIGSCARPSAGGESCAGACLPACMVMHGQGGTHL
jgi:hypothetical protein